MSLILIPFLFATQFTTVVNNKDSALEIGQRLEAVDRRCPQLIRVANIVSIGPPGFFTIAYDGWPEKFNVCLETSCADLFPVGYCQATDHPLQPPPGCELNITNLPLFGLTFDLYSRRMICLRIRPTH